MWSAIFRRKELDSSILEKRTLRRGGLESLVGESVTRGRDLHCEGPKWCHVAAWVNAVLDLQKYMW
jgi:hypothetical protein